MATPEVTIPITAKFKPSGNGGFFLMDAEDIAYKGGSLADHIPVLMSQDAYDELAEAGLVNMNTPYLIEDDGGEVEDNGGTE